jgi:predicted RNase H-like nuclease (RuvC/YqgF family)
MDQTNPRQDDFAGMDTAGAKEYIYHHIVTRKLTEKKLEEAEGELEKWKSRAELSCSGGGEAPSREGPSREALSREAEQKVRHWEAERDTLAGEIEALNSEITRLRRQLPGLAARERSIDPDLLEQELLTALGHTPGEADEEARKTEAEFERLAADTALEALKEKLRQKGP